MTDEKVNMHREDMTIEGDRNLYNYTFTDASGKTVEPEPTLKLAEAEPSGKDPAGKEPGGNLSSKEGENRKG